MFAYLKLPATCSGGHHSIDSNLTINEVRSGLDQILYIKDRRQVQGDNTIGYNTRRYQILPTKTRLGFAKAKVEVQKHLDECIHIFYKGEELPYELIEPQEERRYASSQTESLLVGV